MQQALVTYWGFNLVIEYALIKVQAGKTAIHIALLS